MRREFDRLPPIGVRQGFPWAPAEVQAVLAGSICESPRHNRELDPGWRSGTSALHCGAIWPALRVMYGQYLGGRGGEVLLQGRQPLPGGHRVVAGWPAAYGIPWRCPGVAFRAWARAAKVAEGERRLRPSLRRRSILQRRACSRPFQAQAAAFQPLAWWVEVAGCGLVQALAALPTRRRRAERRRPHACAIPGRRR